jgi:hypothetical protein
MSFCLPSISLEVDLFLTPFKVEGVTVPLRLTHTSDIRGSGTGALGT